jgi:NDP-sugar pyrophosphorylase family protein
MKPIRKAVFPVAGLGTRFLPATKASPKEMLAVVDKPLIQYAVEEAVAAGMTDLIFVTGRHKRAIEDHFDASPELEAELEAKGKLQLLDVVQNILPSNVNCIFVRQPVALGLGHAVLCARPAVSRRGNCWDNAVAESFFSNLKSEQIKKRIYSTRAEAKSEIFDYIEGFYNRVRRHKHLDQLSPHEFERQRQTAL